MIQQDLNNQSNVDKQLARDISQFFRITSTLQQVSTTLRMIPIKQTFQRMSRLVRDLAKNTGKLVAVELIEKIRKSIETWWMRFIIRLSI
jgi:two-component system chemotaxis sensor kinase CheA